MLSPPYALIPQYLITGYYKHAMILIAGRGDGGAVATTLQIYCQAEIRDTREMGGVLWWLTAVRWGSP
jgi:hypothetical protein